MQVLVRRLQQYITAPSTRSPEMNTSSELLPPPQSAYDDRKRLNPHRVNAPLATHRDYNLRISQRTKINENSINLQGWPSRGGIIVLENATPPDFDYLGLDPLDPPLRRDADQDAEDAFCQALLRLGATWWDSQARYTFVWKLEGADEEAFAALDEDETLGPTRLERGWVKVAWPSHTPGALCVLACEKLILGRAGGERLRPRNCGLISLARTMDERCTVMQRLGGTMYASIDEIQDPTFLKAWENHQGEKGPLVKSEFINPSVYRGHPDDALGNFH
jgi:hypothetical protein